MKINNIPPDEHIFLKRLTHLAKKPKSLYVIGTLPSIEVPTVAIVGSRRPTAYGRTVTEQLSEALARRGVFIISGLALGVDAIAHRAALEAGGHTIAVLPSGVDNPYPSSNRELARKILANGDALISEYENGHTPREYDFLFRNRIVSGLADAVIVTEANLRSGTMSTVAHALEQGKPVYAVPGPITSPLSAGCNKLIAQGATPIVSIEECLDMLGFDETNTTSARGDTPLEQMIIDALSSGVTDGDELLSHTKSAPEEFSSALTMLEIKGIVKPLGGNVWRL
jgi:DNA processing protein